MPVFLREPGNAKTGPSAEKEVTGTGCGKNQGIYRESKAIRGIFQNRTDARFFSGKNPMNALENVCAWGYAGRYLKPG